MTLEEFWERSEAASAQLSVRLLDALRHFQADANQLFSEVDLTPAARKTYSDDMVRGGMDRAIRSVFEMSK